MAVVPEDADLPLAEERVTIRKRRHRRKVRVQTVTDKLTETLRATLQTAEVQIERVTVDREVTTPPSIRTEGDVTIIPILEEILVVEKRLVLKEEVRIRRITRTEDVETPVTRRRQRAVVTETNADTIHPKDPDDP